jgi:hypothetical protein
VSRRRRPPSSLPPDLIRVVPQNGMDADCAVASVGTVFGLTRDEALLLCGAVAPGVLAEGMSNEEVTAALRMLGEQFRWLRPGEYDITEATGVLAVGSRRRLEHFVVLWAGRVIDGNGEHWLDPQDYLKHYRYTARELLVKGD